MSGSVLRAPQQVNLDEFERRLRAAATSSDVPEDPLTELARLVGMDNQQRKAAENVVSLGARSAPAPELGHEPLIRVSYAGGAKPAPDVPPPLRPSLDVAPEASAEPAPRLSSFSVEADEEELLDAPGAPVMPANLASGPRKRSNGLWLASVASLSLLGIVGIGGAVALKYGAVPGLRKAPPVIMASAAPTKVAPPSTDTVAPPNDTASVLFKDQQPAKPGAVKVVSTDEQPVDLHSQVAAIAPPAPAPVAPAPPVSPVAANPQAPIVATTIADLVAGATPPAPSPLFAEPKRVKTVSVRPDGTVIAAPSAASPPSAPTPSRSIAALATPAPAADPAPDAVSAQSASPKVDLPVKPRAKSTARVTEGKPDAASAATNGPLQLGPPTKLEKAAKAARAKAAAPVATAQAATPAAAAPVDPTPTATASVSAPAPTPAASSGGEFAVQLAAPGSDQEAQSTWSRLKAKYSSELNGFDATIHKAEKSGGAVYRVRVGGLAKADAVALCDKLKASGGACFVAKN